MTFRENIDAILHYRPYERMPVVSFGFWNETVTKWANEGHISPEDAEDYIKNGDNSEGDRHIMEKLGFDFNWNSCLGSNVLLFPPFEKTVLETCPDGSRIIRDPDGLICREKPGRTVCFIILKIRRPVIIWSWGRRTWLRILSVRTSM